ncbi:hypothetical protein ES332_D08G157000v1 [Gossypium tomentosum]|uniref:RNase H type-1 domain-containing protein n=1 Tax=Gossypium tomentosum TaxID=34277 RepID=A0A5D2JXF2_GOSTO|nr:hypothetical protein ES332_D08G157000v1 [Gossypium tomentosum]
MGFYDLCKFNIALFAKQGAKYFPNTNFWNVNLGSYPSYVWKSIYGTRKLLEDGIGWRVGSGTQISIWRDEWLPVNENIERVADLTDHSSKSWKEGLITSVFTLEEAATIRCIPLSRRVDVDKIVWRGENTLMVASSICPRCGGEPEILMHVGDLVSIGCPSIFNTDDIWAWFDFVFKHGSNYTCKVIAITVWAIWHARNKQVMEGKQQTAQDIRIIVASLVRELDEINRKLPDQRETMKTHWKPPQDPNVKVNFDAAFKLQIHQSCSGGAVKNDYISYSFSAEAIACTQALKFAEEMGFRQIEVECDSRTTIMIINQGVVDRSTMGVYIEDVKAMATRFQRISFKHVDRKANGVGHIIAQERFNLTENTFWVEEVPVAAVEAVN